MRAGACALALAATLALGCNPGRSFIATPNDYADYRSVRLAPTFDDRLAGAWAYLQGRPDGRYAERLRAFVARAEPIYFKVRSQTEAGLVAYLAAMPNGPHAKDALDALMLKRNLARRDALMERATRAMLLQVEAEDKGRRRAASLVEWWLRALLDPAPWHGTFADAPGELLARFRLSAHVPECTVADDGAQHCKKTIEQSYRVRGDKGEVERTLAMTIEVWLDQGYRLLRVKLTGPELALRTHEASSGEARSVDAKQSRDAWRALGERLNAAIIDDNRICSGGEDRASVLTLRCEEPNLVVRLAAGVAGALDSLVIERASSSSLGR